MTDENGKLPSGYVFEGDSAFGGMVTGSAVVAAGATLYFRGLISDDLHIRDGAKVNLHGTVGGVVTMDDATLNVFGSVKGIHHTPASRLWIDRDAMVGDQRYGDMPF